MESFRTRDGRKLTYRHEGSGPLLVSTLVRFRDKQVAAMEAGMLRRKDEPWYPDARAASDLEQTGDFDEAQLPGLAQRMMPFYAAQLGETEREYLGFVESLPINHDALKPRCPKTLGQ